MAIKKGIENENEVQESIINNYVLTLDLGKNSVKAIGRNIEGTAEDIKKVLFRTKMYNMENGYIEVSENEKNPSFKLEIGNEEFVIGEQGEESIESYTTSKTSKLHQYCAYVAISQYIQPNTKNNKIHIVLACPLSVLKVESSKEEYKNLIKGDGIISIKVNNLEYEFEIVDITIKAEDSGITYLMPELFHTGEVAVVGFGGLNMSFFLYKNGVCNSKDRFPEEHGAIQLINYVAEDLTSYKKGNIVDYNTAAEALENGYLTRQGKIDTESVEVIIKSKQRFLEEAKKIIIRNGYDLDRVKHCVFVGGTTMKLHDIISKDLLHSKITENSQWVSVEGLYKVAVKKYVK